ncbi:hypothetical protein DFH07DRAFT_850625 [Mycena maculata]|uniref:Small secreted protein n=1 Tax=Mycena maculata TaxID=230809 RepID=A0AAD7MQT8_9AGAR|nr:hypothetical protein DFH07DRAFT_850625 [Mycena maculata]
MVARAPQIELLHLHLSARLDGEFTFFSTVPRPLVFHLLESTLPLSIRPFTKFISRMARFALLVLLVPALTALAAPIPSKRAATAEFALQSYNAFQISDGVAGQAEAEANAVFVTPFPTDLTTVDATSLANLGTMREAAEDAETDAFNPAIAAASGATANALQVGKIKNKVLKLTGEVQQIKIKIAQAQAAGSSTASLESDLATEQTKLTTNIALDVKAAGQTSQSVSFSG